MPRYRCPLVTVINQVGIFVSLFGQLFLDDGDTDSQGTSTSLTGVIIYESANIPLAFSGVYKEIAFKGEARLDVFYVNAWVRHRRGDGATRSRAGVQLLARCNYWW